MQIVADAQFAHTWRCDILEIAPCSKAAHDLAPNSSKLDRTEHHHHVGGQSLNLHMVLQGSGDNCRIEQ